MDKPYALQPFLDGYIFQTAAGNDYFLLFQDEQERLFPEIPQLSGKIFSLLFFPLELHVPQQHDARILTTVVQGLSQKMSDTENAVLFIVDDADQRQHARWRLFNRLFETAPQSDVLLISGAVWKGGAPVMSGLFVHRQNPFREMVVTRFFDLLRDFSKD